MKHSVAKKFLAFLLAACSFAAVLVCGSYALLLNEYGLYNSSPEEKMEQWYRMAGEPVALQAAGKRASQILGGCSEGLAEQLYGFLPNLNREYYYVTIQHDGEIIPVEGEPIPDGITFEYSVKPRYAKMVRFYPTYIPETTSPEASEGMVMNPQATEPVHTDKEPDYDEKVDILEDGQQLIYEVKYYEDSSTYTVSVTMSSKALQETFHANMIAMYPHRNSLIWGAALALILTIAAAVYLICAAGHTTDGSICPGGLNRLPLDVYLLGVAAGIYILANQMWIIYASNNGLNFLMASILVLMGIAIGMLILGVIFALAAQIKVGKGYWWRHSLLGRFILRLIMCITALFSKLGIVWQWLLIAVSALTLTILSYLCAVWNNWNLLTVVLAVICSMGCLGIIGYGSWSFAMIVSGARKMAGGELDYKIPTEQMHGSFRVCAEQMNSLSETTMQAVQSQVRAERMKTELITNVSHDIKTPLTSIINFVDLLSRSHDEESERQYLEVLSRQSLRMKKLIEDLIELSKASSGNLQPNITILDAAESVNQALGEFADKMESAQLTPVFYQPEGPVLIAADGRLTWRVLSNLLSNTVKYATPGTRVYVEITRAENKVLLSIKNVSKEELRLTADELMERFVRGDASRNREGSGLGLNIAKSLMEAQHGSLQLILDGDLFKVTLTFPAAEE